MKKQVLIALIVCFATMSYAQSSGDFPVPLSDPAKRGKLKAHLNYGSITVKGTARKDVLVKYSSVSEGKDHDNKSGKEGLKRISGGTMDLEVSENSNYVKVESGSWNNKMDLVIEVPTGFDVKVSSYNDGDILISNVEGEVEITTYNGEIAAENISGSVIATTYNGEIKVTFDKVKEGVPMSYSTYNGDIDITFPAALKATFKMKTEQGEILSGFDMKMIESGPVQKKDTKSGTYKVVIDEWVKGEVNGGGPEISMRNYNGDVIIRKK
jgi:Putative adhesin